MRLSDLAPYTWAFCLTAYKAPTAESARATTAANRATPRTGCNGYPFSRMKVDSGPAKPTALRPAFHAAIAAAIDSERTGTRVTARVSAIFVDVESFSQAATRISGLSEDWTGFAGAVHTLGRDLPADEAKLCRPQAMRSCTLDPGVELVQLQDAEMRDGQLLVTIHVWWAHRDALGFAEFKVRLRDGRIVSVERGSIT